MAKAKVKVFTLQEQGSPRMFFYVPGVINDKYVVSMYPGFNCNPTDYAPVARKFTEEGMITVITDWHDGGEYSHEHTIETTYRSVDVLKREIGRYQNVMGIGHSFGAERLLKAALLDRERRFTAITAVQPPDHLGKYTRNHNVLNFLSRVSGLNYIATLTMRAMHKNLGVRNHKDVGRLMKFIDDDTSLISMIGESAQNMPPTLFICSRNDPHVSYHDAIAASEKLREKGVVVETAELYKLSTDMTQDEMDGVADYSRSFFERVARQSGSLRRRPNLNRKK
ncbi:MAG: hypothetical protein WC613_01590 [Candidatus Aenigmatarchaeota archaeon]